MTTDIQLPLDSFDEWIRQTDRHAAQRLAVLNTARAVLNGDASVPSGQRRDLAERLERWRYQLLNAQRGRMKPEDERLAEALDLAANQLAGCGPRAPRSAWRAICEGVDFPDLAEARAVLDPGYPLEEATRRAVQITEARFGGQTRTGSERSDAPVPISSQRRRMLLYAPLYLSSHCINYCAYCGFRHPQDIERKHLDLDEAIREAQILMARGFRHILLVAGDFPSLTTTGYYVEIIRALAARGVVPSVEIAPQATASYAEMVEAGACGVTLYQETYQEDLYPHYHPRGTKASFDWRLEGLERAAEAGMKRLGLGVLLGLADSRKDFLALARHGHYLRTRFPDRTIAFSLPRIRDAAPGFVAPFTVDDETFVRLYCALRIAFPGAELLLSTREAPDLRNRLARTCITQMSAGSSTAPGGYDAGEQQAGEQFPVCDTRSPAEVAQWLQGEGLDVRWETRGL